MANLGRRTLFFSTGTFLSRISGLARDMMVAAFFGGSNALDAYLIANRIPNLFRDMLAEGALGSSFTKVYAEVNAHSANRSAALLSISLRWGFVFLIAASIAGALLAPVFVFVFTAFSTGRPAEFQEITVELTRFTFPFLGFATLSAILLGVLQERHQFFLAGFAPAIMNLVLMAVLFLLPPLLASQSSWPFANDPLTFSLTLGFLLGGVAYFVLQYWVVAPKFLPTTIEAKADFRRVLVLAVPAALAASTANINVLVNTNFAAALTTGSVTWLNFAFRLFHLPVGLFGVGVAAVILPEISRTIARSEDPDRKATEGLNLVLALMLPCMFMLAARADDIVGLLFERGSFSAVDRVNTAGALRMYSLGVVSYGMNKVLSSLLYAKEKTNMIFNFSLISLGFNFIGNLLLVDSFGFRSLALVASLSLIIQTYLMVYGCRAAGYRISTKPFYVTISQLGGSMLLVWLCLVAMDEGLPMQHLAVNVQRTIRISYGLVLFFGVALISRELRGIWRFRSE